MSQVDPGQVFTGGCEIIFLDPMGAEYREKGHISLEAQPLTAFVDAVMTQKCLIGPFEIIEFCPHTCKIKVRLLDGWIKKPKHDA